MQIISSRLGIALRSQSAVMDFWKYWIKVYLEAVSFFLTSYFEIHGMCLGVIHSFINIRGGTTASPKYITSTRSLLGKQIQPFGFRLHYIHLVGNG